MLSAQTIPSSLNLEVLLNEKWFLDFSFLFLFDTDIVLIFDRRVYFVREAQEVQEVCLSMEGRVEEENITIEVLSVTNGTANGKSVLARQFLFTFLLECVKVPLTYSNSKFRIPSER